MDEPPQTYEGEEVEIYTLADEYGAVQNHGFVDCTIVGPAVLATSESYWAKNRTTSRLDYVVLDLNPEQTVVNGAILVHRCSFERCLFHRIAFFVHADQREAFRREFVEEEADIPPSS